MPASFGAEGVHGSGVTACNAACASYDGVSGCDDYTEVSLAVCHAAVGDYYAVLGCQEWEVLCVDGCVSEKVGLPVG